MCQYVSTWGKKQSIESDICLKKTIKGEFGGKPTTLQIPINSMSDSRSPGQQGWWCTDSFDVKDQTDPELKLEKGPDQIYLYQIQQTDLKTYVSIT